MTLMLLKIGVMRKNSPNNYEKQYFIYNRKSTDDADNQKNSLSYQRSRNIDFAQREILPLATAVTIPDFCTNGIIDESHSAFKETDEFIISQNGSVQYKILRPKFRMLVDFLNEKKINGVIFLCWDRASRNDQDNLIIKKLLARGYDIRFSETQYEKSSAGKLHMNIDGMFSEHYSAVISEKIRNANSKLRAEGKCLYNAPIGYLDEGSDNKPLDAERASFVKSIFELYATGKWSFNQLGKWASNHGLTKRPVRRKRTKEEILNNVSLESIPRTPRPVDHKTIEYILRNPFYIGKIKVNDSYKDSTAHQALIDTSLFFKVQEILKKRRSSVYFIDKQFYSYRGLLRCECGRAYSPYMKKGIIYYRSRCKVNCLNENPNMKEDDISQLIQEVLDTMYFTKNELEEIEQRAEKDCTELSDQKDKTLNNLHSRKRTIISDLDYLEENKITLLRTNTMDIDMVHKEKERLESKLAVLNRELDINSADVTDMLNNVITLSELVKNIGMYFKYALDHDRREITFTVFTELIIKSKKLKKYDNNNAFDILVDRSWVTGTPDALFSELYRNQVPIKDSINKIKKFGNTTTKPT